MIVALIDSGVDLHQPALVSHVCGWNFVNNSSDLQDKYGHGTEMSNLVLKANPNARLMILKVFDNRKEIKSENIAKAIDYAVSHGANIINISLTSPKSDVNVTESIQKALNKGIKVIAAAGNKGQSKPLFPASVPGVLSVIAVDENGLIKRWSNANSGKEKESVSVNIDKVSIYTLGGKLKPASGTSSAAAYYSCQLSRQL